MTMVKKSEIPKHIVDTSLALAAERGWRELSLTDIAAAADVPIGTLIKTYRSKSKILAAYARRVDEAVADGAETGDLDQPVRDRIFDVLMRRFDAMKADRDALRAIARDIRREPLSALGAGCSVLCSMATMLETAGVSSSGTAGLVRAKGLSAIYLSVLRVWLDDDTEDFSRTMAALDRNLDKAERAMAFLCRRRGATRASSSPSRTSARCRWSRCCRAVRAARCTTRRTTWATSPGTKAPSARRSPPAT